MKIDSKLGVGIVTLGIVLLLAGCHGHDGDHGHADADAADAGGETEPAAEEASLTVEVGPAAQAMLALADHADGAGDHVVSKCPGCRLAMEGDAAHAMKAGEYELHFCSDTCRDDFAKHAEEAIVALDLSAEDKPEGEAH
ncbi:MAG: hypothetical protein GY716_20570 [bacterium]|nr:hypothetical protein [bacterium]